MDRSTLQSIFEVVWIMVLTSLGIILVEGVAVWRMAPWVFRLGYPLLRRSIPAATARPVGLPDQPSEIGEARVRWLGPRECVFRRRSELFRFDIHTPFPLKCTLRWEGQQAIVTGRLPIGTLGFLGAWLVGWSAGVAMAITNRVGLVGYTIVLVGWGVVVGLCAVSLRFERRRATAMVQQILSFHASATA